MNRSGTDKLYKEFEEKDKKKAKEEKKAKKKKEKKEKVSNFTSTCNPTSYQYTLYLNYNRFSKYISLSEIEKT